MNKHKSKASSAFSLIELSIVILIIGIIIAGITQSSRLVRQSKLKSAQNLTQSSPVAGIKSIALWLETSQESSFPAPLDDAARITQWNDTNPQTINKLFALPLSSVEGTAKYVLNGINGLPSIKFDGAATSTLAVTKLNTLGNVCSNCVPVVTNEDPTKSQAFTAFIVYRLDDTQSAGTAYTALYNGLTGTNGWGYSKAANDKRTVAVSATPTAAASVAMPTTQEFATITYTGYNSDTSQGTKTTTLYINGNNYALGQTSPNDNHNSDTTGVVVEPTLNMYIGGTTGASQGAAATLPWKGFISEIIIFDSVLLTADLKEVASYLSKKYNIPLQ